MTENPHVVLLYSLEIILSYGMRRNKPLSRSSTEAKYKALANTTAAIIWIQTLLKELQVTSPPHTKVWVDNMGVKYLAFNPIFHDKMKHVEVDYHFVRKRVAKRLLEVDYVTTGDQTADGFTKGLTMRKLENFKYNLNMRGVIERGC
jgi:hypothetical protein